MQIRVIQETDCAYNCFFNRFRFLEPTYSYFQKPVKYTCSFPGGGIWKNTVIGTASHEPGRGNVRADQPEHRHGANICGFLGHHRWWFTLFVRGLSTLRWPKFGDHVRKYGEAMTKIWRPVTQAHRTQKRYERVQKQSWTHILVKHCPSPDQTFTCVWDLPTICRSFSGWETFGFPILLYGYPSDTWFGLFTGPISCWC